MIVIIPTNRQINPEYLTPLIDSGARFIIIDDSEGCVKLDHPQFEVYHWGDRKKMLGHLDIGFPKKNGACRDFGFYIAWKTAEPHEIIIALDDDCKVYHPDFPRQVEQVLSPTPRPVVTTTGDHLNIFDLYQNPPDYLYPRGFPYSSRVDYSGITIKKPENRHVTFSLGMWKGILDINGIDKIKGPPYNLPDAELKFHSVIVEKEKLISVCSMNMQFRKELIPAVYQLPMHVEAMPEWVIDRYGDIWGGFILKTLMDIKGDAMAVGEPMITHLKEGNFTRNIWQEHICHLVNDEFIRVLSVIKDSIKPESYLQMMEAICEGFKQNAGGSSALLKPYLLHLSKAMAAWNKALS